MVSKGAVRVLFQSSQSSLSRHFFLRVSLRWVRSRPSVVSYGWRPAEKNVPPSRFSVLVSFYQFRLKLNSSFIWNFNYIPKQDPKTCHIIPIIIAKLIEFQFYTHELIILCMHTLLKIDQK